MTKQNLFQEYKNGYNWNFVSEECIQVQRIGNLSTCLEWLKQAFSLLMPQESGVRRLLVLDQWLIDIRIDDLWSFSLFFFMVIWVLLPAPALDPGPRKEREGKVKGSVCHVFPFYFPGVFLAEFHIQVSQTGQKSTCSWKGGC